MLPSRDREPNVALTMPKKKWKLVTPILFHVSFDNESFLQFVSGCNFGPSFLRAVADDRVMSPFFSESLHLKYQMHEP